MLLHIKQNFRILIALVLQAPNVEHGYGDQKLKSQLRATIEKGLSLSNVGGCARHVGVHQGAASKTCMSNLFTCILSHAADFTSSNDSGLNLLFSDRVEERIVHEEPVRLALARKEHPDRVYGLQKTKNFAKALCSPSSKPVRADGGPVLVDETIRITPFKQVGEPLLFPFLILEAKSAKGDDFDSIQKQTAFPIRTLLKIQADLRNECEQRISWQGGPLVWFLYNRGEDWRVAACFVENTDDEESYVCFQTIYFMFGYY